MRKIGAITLFVDDVARAKAWYERVFELPFAYEDDVSAVVEFENTLVNLLARTEAEGLIGPAPVGVSGAASAFQFTIWVDDLDAAVATLTSRGVELVNGPLDRPWGQRTALFADPDGHLWELAQPLG